MLANHKHGRGDHADDEGRDDDQAKCRSEHAAVSLSSAHAANSNPMRASREHRFLKQTKGEALLETRERRGEGTHYERESTRALSLPA